MWSALLFRLHFPFQALLFVLIPFSLIWYDSCIICLCCTLLVFCLRSSNISLHSLLLHRIHQPFFTIFTSYSYFCSPVIYLSKHPMYISVLPHTDLSLTLLIPVSRSMFFPLADCSSLSFIFFAHLSHSFPQVLYSFTHTTLLVSLAL